MSTWVGRGVLRVGDVDVAPGEEIPKGKVAPPREAQLKKLGLVKDGVSAPKPKKPAAAGPKTDKDF
jgi:hypothetical protein